MRDLKSLPKVPEQALALLLRDLLEKIPSESKAFDTYSRNAIADWKIIAKAGLVAARRCSDQDVRSLAEDCLQIVGTEQSRHYVATVERLLELTLASEFDDHFLDEEAIQKFDEANLSTSDIAQIQGYLATARVLAQTADYLSDEHKKRIIFRISKVENELYRPKAGFQAFLAAAAESAGLVEKYGNAAKPLAEAIQMARTTTERKVEGYAAIESEPKPKQIEGPKSQNE